MGEKTWHPGKNLHIFIATAFGISLRDQLQIVDQIGAAIAEVGPLVRLSMEEHPGFREIGKRMLVEWQSGIDGLRNKRTYNLGNAALGDAFEGFSAPQQVKSERLVSGRSSLLGRPR